MGIHRRGRSTLVRVALPIAGGACVAVLSTLLLSKSLLWIALLLGVGFVAIPSLVVKDRMAYWLCLFLLTLPFDISKTFMEPAHAIALVDTVGGSWIGPPALNLHLIDLALLPLLGLWLIGKVRRRERIWFPRISYVPLTFLCFVTATALAAPFPYFAVLGLIKHWKYFLIYVFAADALDIRKFGSTILTILLLTLFLQGALTAGRYQFQSFKPFFGEAFGRTSATVVGEAEGMRRVVPDREDSPERGFGTFYHANTTAMHLELLLPFALVLALSRRSRRWTFVYACLFVVGTIGHHVTFSRAGLLAFLASTVVCVFLASLRGLIPRRMLGPLAGIGLVVAVLLVPFVAAHLQTRPEESSYHLDHLRHGLTIALRHPIFGVGLNNSTVVRPYVIEKGLLHGEHLVPIHSQHLIYLSETGVIGFSLYMGFFLLVGLEAFRQSRSENLYARTFSIAILGAYTALCVHMITDYLGFDASHVSLWLYAGLVIGQRRWKPVATTARQDAPNAASGLHRWSTLRERQEAE